MLAQWLCTFKYNIKCIHLTVYISWRMTPLRQCLIESSSTRQGEDRYWDIQSYFKRINNKKHLGGVSNPSQNFG